MSRLHGKRAGSIRQNLGEREDTACLAAIRRLFGGYSAFRVTWPMAPILEGGAGAKSPDR